MISQEQIDQFARIIADAKHLVVATGAGMSKESGIPTFRDAHDGLWARYDPQELATPEAFARNPKLVWDWYQYRLSLINSATPNAGHHSLVSLEDLVPKLVIITQNIDGFHDVVGSSDVISLHGSIQRYKCFDDCHGSPTLVDLNTLSWDKEKGPPTCPHCGKGLVRPDVVWFGEMLPSHAINRAQEEAINADVMLVIGTSGMVQPAASLPYIAARRGATVLEINPQASGISMLAELRLAAGAAEALPLVVESVRTLLQN